MKTEKEINHQIPQPKSPKLKSSSSIATSETPAASTLLQWSEEITASSSRVLGGDINRDGEVNATDLSIIAENWGRGPPERKVDLNGDGVVDIYDLVGAGLNFGKGGE